MSTSAKLVKFCTLSVLVGLAMLQPTSRSIAAAMLAQAMSEAGHQTEPNVSQNAKADELFRQGEAFLQAGQLQEALQAFQQVLKIQRAVQDRSQEAAVLDKVGETYDALGRYTEALDVLQQALILWREVGSIAGEGESLFLIGAVYRNQERHDESLEILQRSLEIRQQLADQIGEAETLNVIGATYISQGKIDQGLSTLQQALAVLKGNNSADEAQDRHWHEGRILAWLGVAHLNLQQPEQASQFLEQALAVNREVGDRLMEGTTLFFLGNFYTNQNQLSEALEQYQQALAIFEPSGDRSSIAYLQNYVGVIYFKQEQYTEALAAFQNALSIHREMGNRSQEAQVLANLGDTYEQQERFTEAIEAYQQALVVYQEVENLRGQFDTLHNIGSIYGDLRQYPRMREYFQQAIAIARKMEDPVAEAISTVRFGQGYQSQGNIDFLGNALFQPGLEAHQQGLEAFQAALEIIPTIPDSEKLKAEIERQALLGISTSYMGVSEAHNGLKQYSEATEAAQQALIFAQRVDDLDYQSEALNKLVNASHNWGRQYQAEGNFQQALAIHQQELKYGQQLLRIARETQDSDRINSALSHLDVTYFYIADVYNDLERYPEAIEAYQQELLINREMGDRPSEASTLHVMANQYENLSQYSQALERYQQALVIYRNLQNQQQELTALRSIGNIYLTWGQYPDALEQYQQALSIAQAQNYSDAEASTLINIGGVYFAQGQYALALTQYQQALNIHRQIQQQLQQPDAIDRIDTLCPSSSAEYSPQTSGDLVGYSRDLYRQYLEYRRTDCLKTSRYAESAALHSIALVYSSQGRYSEAMNLLQQSLAISVEYNDPSEQAPTLSVIGGVYANQGQYTQALDYYQQALAIYRNAEIRNEESSVLNLMSTIYEAQGQYAQALETNQQALEIARSIPNVRVRQADSIGYLGITYNRLGQYDQSLELHQQALAAYREIGDCPGEATALGDIGNIYRKQNQADQALEYYQQALAIWQEIGAVANESSTLNNIGLIYQAQGQIDRAIPLFERSIEIQQSIGAQARLADSLQGLGLAYIGQGNSEAAMSNLQQAIATYRTVGDRAGEALALSNVGQLLAQQNQPELAIAFLKQSVNVTEAIRGDIRGLDQELQQSYADSVADAYRQLADLLLERGDVLGAQQVLELLKLQEVREFTRGAVLDVGTRQIEQTDVEKRVIATYGSLVDLGRKLNECGQTCAEYGSLRSHRIALTEEYNQAVQELQPEVQQRFDEDTAALNPEEFIGKAGELLENHPYTMLIYPIVLENKLWLLWGTSGGVVNSISVPVGREDLGKVVLQYRQAMQNCELGGCGTTDIPAIQAIAQELYRNLIPPQLETEFAQLEQQAAAHGQTANLVFSLDRVARYIPMATLFDGQRYLVERFAVSTILSAGTTNSDNPLPVGAANTSVLALGLSEDVQPIPEQEIPGFRALQFVPTELASIVQNSTQSQGIFPGLGLLNDRFNEQSFEQMAGYQILHIATHGEFVPSPSDLSYLILGNRQPFRIRQIENIQQDFAGLSLVVLSACETALGDAGQDGVEINSIAASFIQARVNTVVASLWQVNDRSTNIFMQQFYSSLAQSSETERISVSQAMRQAQLQMLTGGHDGQSPRASSNRGDDGTLTAEPIPGSRAATAIDPNYAHPYYWSPFIIIGNGL